MLRQAQHEKWGKPPHPEPVEGWAATADAPYALFLLTITNPSPATTAAMPAAVGIQML